MTTLYGISNCDTVKKAKTWLQNQNIDYVFHDYKKSGVDTSFLQNMIEQHGLDIVVNKRGTTYRKLDQSQKDQLGADNAAELLSENTSMIKRPILIHQDKSLIGFKADEYDVMFANT